MGLLTSQKLGSEATGWNRLTFGPWNDTVVDASFPIIVKLP